jgi:hypothetical protein
MVIGFCVQRMNIQGGKDIGMLVIYFDF